MRSDIGSIVDEIHEDNYGDDDESGQYLKDTYMKKTTTFQEKWQGASEFYSPNPRIVESNLTIGMMVNTHIVHGHSHMRCVSLHVLLYFGC
jgi:hypothetical protein